MKKNKNKNKEKYTLRDDLIYLALFLFFGYIFYNFSFLDNIDNMSIYDGTPIKKEKSFFPF